MSFQPIYALTCFNLADLVSKLLRFKQLEHAFLALRTCTLGFETLMNKSLVVKQTLTYPSSKIHNPNNIYLYPYSLAI
jgi:hypothetical protein